MLIALKVYAITFITFTSSGQVPSASSWIIHAPRGSQTKFVVDEFHTLQVKTYCHSEVCRINAADDVRQQTVTKHCLLCQWQHTAECRYSNFKNTKTAAQS